MSFKTQLYTYVFSQIQLAVILFGIFIFLIIILFKVIVNIRLTQLSIC